MIVINILYNDKVLSPIFMEIENQNYNLEEPKALSI